MSIERQQEILQEQILYKIQEIIKNEVETHLENEINNILNDNNSAIFFEELIILVTLTFNICLLFSYSNPPRKDIGYPLN